MHFRLRLKLEQPNFQGDRGLLGSRLYEAHAGISGLNNGPQYPTVSVCIWGFRSWAIEVEGPVAEM